MPDLEQAKAYALHRLEDELSPRLVYHSLKHTRDEVAPAVQRLAAMEQVGAADQLLLLTAAYFHDLGYLQQRQGHELASMQLAGEVLPGFGYAGPQIGVIQGVIRATIFPQNPASLLGQILADADLDTLGHPNFWQRGSDLRQELLNFGQQFSDADWYTSQMNFLAGHHYFTRSQQTRRDTLKRQHWLEAQRLAARSQENQAA